MQTVDIKCHVNMQLLSDIIIHMIDKGFSLQVINEDQQYIHIHGINSRPTVDRCSSKKASKYNANFLAAISEDK